LEAFLTDRFKFYMRNSGVDYFIPVFHNSGEMLQMVSIDPQGMVIGYFGARINRETDAAYDLQVINFESKNDIFSADLYDFFTSLYDKYGAEKAVFSVIVGNPAEALYDKVIKHLGGRIVGTFKQDVKLYDGKLYDVKWYEIAQLEFCYKGRDKWRNWKEAHK
jgi:hypothetical protein